MRRHLVFCFVSVMGLALVAAAPMLLVNVSKRDLTAAELADFLAIRHTCLTCHYSKPPKRVVVELLRFDKGQPSLLMSCPTVSLKSDTVDVTVMRQEHEDGRLKVSVSVAGNLYTQVIPDPFEGSNAFNLSVDQPKQTEPDGSAIFVLSFVPPPKPPQALIMRVTPEMIAPETAYRVLAIRVTPEF